MSGFRRLLMANAGRKYAPEETVFDVEATADSLTLGFLHSGYATIDFGDGARQKTENNVITTGNMTSAHGITHTYSAPGTYTVRIIPDTGKKYWTKFAGGASSYYPDGAARLATRVRQIGTSIYRCDGMFASTARDILFDAGVKVPKGAVSAESFISGTVVTNLNDDFTLPDGVTSVAYFAYYNTALTRLPPTFRIPMTVKSMNRFLQLYKGALKWIPPELKIPAICTDLTNAFATNRLLEFDVTNLFPDEWEAGGYTSILNGIFSDCNSITGRVPLWLFDGRNNFTFNTSSFVGCTNLTNYNEIPASWGGGGA